MKILRMPQILNTTNVSIELLVHIGSIGMHW
jgi:hypothetical protein